jgi:uncharacterized protein (TIGR00725 family)
MKLAIGVMGSASSSTDERAAAKAFQLGRSIAERGCTLVTGGCPGLPYAAVLGARGAGGLVVGISPGLSLDEHLYKYDSPIEGFDVMIYTGSGLMGREVENIRSSDMVVFVGGRSGTLGEFAIAYDEGKLIGVLTGTGGVADAIADLVRLCDKDTGAVVLYDEDPARLVGALLQRYQDDHHKYPSCFALCPRPLAEEAQPLRSGVPAIDGSRSGAVVQS